MSLVTSDFIGTDTDTLKKTFARLAADLKGQVITPEDADYDAARTGLSRDSVRRPALIVRPVDAFDVSQVVLLARELDMELAIRSGGHSLAGFSTSEGGIVLDFSLMKGLKFECPGFAELPEIRISFLLCPL